MNELNEKSKYLTFNEWKVFCLGAAVGLTQVSKVFDLWEVVQPVIMLTNNHGGHYWTFTVMYV